MTLPGLYSIGFSTPELWPPHPALQNSTTYATLAGAQGALRVPGLRWRHGTYPSGGHFWDADLPDGRRARIDEALGVVGVDTSSWPRARDGL